MLRAGYAWGEFRRYAARVRLCVTWLAALGLMSGCETAHKRPQGAATTASKIESQADLLPRVPSHDGNVTLRAQVTNLAFGSVAALVVNHTNLPPISHDGIVPLLADVPIGTLYNVSMPANPRGQVCTVTPLHGAVGPRTPYVEVTCKPSVVTANDVNDSVVVGQLDDVHVIAQSPPGDATLRVPWGKVFTSIDGTMFVADRGNQRVVGYYPLPLSGASAATVLGQNNDFSGSAANSGTLGFTGPSGVGGGNALLLVTDTNNNRVLMYTPTPYGQVDPAWVVGQANFTASAPTCGPAGLAAPSQAMTSGNVLWVADTGNHRVLAWNSWPTRSGVAADVVLGQSSLTSCLPNQGTGQTSESTLSSPQDVWTDQNRIAVADTGNRRVLIWLTLPVVTGQIADLAVGQPDLLSGGNQTTSATSLNGPVSVVFDDNTLYVADSVDHRVLAFNPFPTSSGATATYALGQHVATDHLCNQGNLVAAFTLCQPTGVSFVAGDLAVTDSNNNRVLLFYTNPNAVGVGSFGVVIPGHPFLMSKLLAADAVAGESVTALVTALDFSGQIASGYTGTVGFLSTDPNAILPNPYTFSPGESGTHAFNVTFFAATTHTLRVYDVQNAAVSGSDPAVLVSAADANFMMVTGFPYHPNAGQQVAITVTAYDRWHNVATGFAGTVRFSSSDPNAILPPPYAFGGADLGAHAFTVTLMTPGNQSVTVNANGLAVFSSTQPNIIVGLPLRSLGGAVTGLITGNVTLTNTSNGDIISVGNGNFIFDQNIVYGQSYNVVAASPSGQTCTITNGNAVMGVSGAYNVWVACASHAYALGGVVTGLPANTNVTLQDNSETVSVGNGNFVFPASVASGSSFTVSLANPNGYACLFINSSNVGVMPASNDMNIVVSCTPSNYSLGGFITGLLSNTNVTLSDGNDTVLRTNGGYTFPTSLPSSRAYNIGLTNPSGQICVFNPNTVGSGVVSNANVSNANVLCTTNTYPLGGGVTGLVTGNITLTNTVNSDAISVGNGNYIFDQNIAYAGNYNVSAASPNGLSCAVTNGNAVMTVGGAFNAYVACSPKTYTLGGAISGLLSNTNVTLQNGADTILSGNGNFTFPTGVAYNSNFSAGLSNPSGQTCVFTSNSNAGVMPATTNANIRVTCSTNTYSLGGNVSGLLANTNVTLSDGNDTLSRISGSYNFPTLLPYGRLYSIGLTNPNGQTCAFNPNSVGSGTMGAAPVTNANVVCSTNTYPLGGTVTGLVTGNITLTNAVNADAISAGNGNYTFDQNIAYAGNYNVVAASPSGLTCAVANGNAAMAVGGAFNVNVGCLPRSYSLGGTVSGLLTNTNISLQNGADTILSANGNFTFPTSVAYNSNFNASLVSPSGQACMFGSNSNVGVMPASNDMNIVVSCTPSNYSLGGFITGLLSNTNVTLSDGNDTVLRTNGGYTFPTSLPSSRAYNIGLTNPSGQTCVFNPNTVGSGVVSNANVSNVNVLCTTDTYPLGGGVTGLVTGNITLTNTVNSDAISVGNGNYIFDQNIAYAGNYNVSAASPNGLSCAVTNGNAVMAVGGAFNAYVACSPKTYTLGGAISGLLSNTNVTLQNGADTILSGNGNFTFPTGVAYNSNFSASLSNPSGQTCVFTSNSNAGVMPAATNANIRVTCSTNTYSLGGNVSGLLANTNVTLSDGNDTLSRINGPYNFPTLLPYGRLYSIGLTNPNGQTCAFNPNSVGSGTMGAAPVTNANVVCTTNTYALGGGVTGLLTGNVTLTNTVNGDIISVGNGNYLFDQNVVYAANYNVVVTSPSGQSCTVQNGNAVMVVGGNFNVMVTCAATPATYLVLSNYSTPRTAGQNSNINVTAFDSQNHVAIGYVGTVHLTSSDSSAVFGNANFTFVSAYAGSANVPITMKTSGTQSVTGNDTVSPTIAGKQTAIVVNPNTATTLTLSGYTTPRAAGVNSNITVTAYDFYNNIATGYSGTIHFTTADTNAISPNFTFVTAYAGSASVPITMKTVGTWSITGNDTVTSSIAGKQTGIVVTPANANYYVLAGYPNPINACQQANVSVTVYDAYGNIATTYTGTIDLSSSDGNADVASDYTFVAGNLGSKSFPVTLHTAGTWNISGNDTMSPSLAGVQSAIVVRHTAAVSFGVTDFPNPVTAGQQGNVTIKAYDACGNLDTNYLGTVHVTSTDTNAILPTNYTFTAANAGVATRSFTFKTSGGQNINANDTVTTSISGQQNVSVNPNVATYYRVANFPAQTNIAVQANVHVTAYDYYNNVATNYTGTVQVRSTDGSATLPANYTYTSTNAGVAKIPVRLNSWGTWAISANDTVTANISGQQSNILVAFTPMNPTPSGSVGLSGQVWHRGATTTGSDPPQLADLVAQYNYGQVTAPNDFFVNSHVNTTRHLVYSGNTGSATSSYLGSDAAGSAASDGITMYSTSLMYSGYMVVAAGGNYTIATTSADDGAIAYIGGGPQGGNTTLVTLRNWTSGITTAPGYAQPAVISLNQAGAYPLTIFHFNQSGGAGLDFNMYGPAAVTFLSGPAPWVGTTRSFVLSMSPNPINPGAQGSLTITPNDANGLVSNYSGTVTISTDDTTAVISTPYTFSGTATVPIVFRRAGTWALTANDVSSSAVAGAQTGIVVNDTGVATYFTVAYANVTAGTSSSVTLTAINATGTTATNYTGTVRITSSDTNAVLPSNYTFTAGNNGVASVSVTLKTITANATITATDTTNSSINGSVTNIQVYPAPNASAPGGSTGLKGTVWHRLTDTSLPSPPTVADLASGAVWAYTHTANYTFTNSHVSSTLVLNYSGGDGTNTNTYLSGDAAGSASSDGNRLYTTYIDYSGYLHVSGSGNYNFILSNVDDGALVFLGGGTAPGITTLIMAGNSSASQLLTNFSSPLVLHLPAAGYYPIEIFYENQYANGGTGGANLNFSISGPNTVTMVTGNAIGFLSQKSREALESLTLAVPPRPVVAIGDPVLLAQPPQALRWPPSASGVEADDATVFPYLPSRTDRHDLAFWSNGAVYRHEIAALEDLETSLAGPAVLKIGTEPTPPSEGIWLLNAIRQVDGSLVGLYRSVEHQRKQGDSNTIYYTSGTALSNDDGRTWRKQGPVVGQPSALDMMGVLPEVRCMIFDSHRDRWLGVGHGLGYISRDPNAAPGTWYGWHEGHFDQPEPDTNGSNLLEPLPGLSEDMDECKLHYNTYLELFVLLFRPWDGSAIMQSYSRDGVAWSHPTSLMKSTSQQKLSHAQIIGTSDVSHGRRARLVYRHRVPGQSDPPVLMQRALEFTQKLPSK